MVLDVYVEGERLARFAVQNRVHKEQLDILRQIALIRNKKGIELWIKRQPTRRKPPFRWGFAKGLLELLDKCPNTIVFARIVGIAHAIYDWAKVEPAIKCVEDSMDEIRKVVHEYAHEHNLGDVEYVELDSKCDGEFLITIVVRFERRPPDEEAAGRTLHYKLCERVRRLKKIRFFVEAGGGTS